MSLMHTRDALELLPTHLFDYGMESWPVVSHGWNCWGSMVWEVTQRKGVVLDLQTVSVVPYVHDSHDFHVGDIAHPSIECLFRRLMMEFWNRVCLCICPFGRQSGLRLALDDAVGDSKRLMTLVCV